MEEFNHQVELITGVMEEECATVLQEFFKALRARNKSVKESKTNTNNDE
jgi:tRNA(adenine34) deaminase